MSPTYLGILILTGMIPVAVIILKLIFGKSIMFKIGMLAGLFTIFFGIFTFYAGSEGLINFYWIFPSLVVSGSFVYWLINLSIRKPLGKAIGQLKILSEGDLGVKIKKSNAGNELGVLYNSIIKLTEILTKVTSEINTGAHNIYKTSQSLQNASEQLSSASNEQAGSVEELNSTMEEMSAILSENVNNAKKTFEAAEKAGNSLENVAQKAENSLNANKEIVENISLIDDIAYKINLLSLNAAVEAASAGEHGKGFTVVAAEIKKLADSSKKTAHLIITMAKSVHKQYEETDKVIKETIPEVGLTNTLVKHISDSVIEQNSGVTQINKAVTQLNAVAQRNAAFSEELASSAEEMVAQSENLKNLTSFFKAK